MCVCVGEAVQLLLEFGEAEFLFLLFVVGVLEHDPYVDQVGGGEDVEERGGVRHEAYQAGLGRLGAVGVLSCSCAPCGGAPGGSGGVL